MTPAQDDSNRGRRAAIVGVAAAPTLLLLALLIGLAEGGLLPGECQGLACLFTGLVLGATGVIVAVWLVVWLGIRAAGRAWPDDGWGLWVMRVLAAVSWAPVAWLAILALD